MLKNLIYKISTKISRRVRALARNYVLLVLHYCLFPIIGLSENSITGKERSETLWHDWREHNRQALTEKQSGKNWLIYYLSWAFRSKNLWMVSLLPFIIILKSVERPSDTPAPESLLTYTLY